jgi:hypothetical protein
MMKRGQGDSDSTKKKQGDGGLPDYLSQVKGAQLVVGLSPISAPGSTPIDDEYAAAKARERTGRDPRDAQKWRAANPQMMQQAQEKILHAQAVLNTSTLSPEQRKAWELEVQKLQFNIQAGEDAMNFDSEFTKWLLGKGKEEDHINTPWYRTPLTMGFLPNVTEYLDRNIDIEYKFKEQLTLLYMRGPTDLDTAYLYFKYIVRGDISNFDSYGFLQEWNAVQERNPIKLGVEPELMGKISTFWSHQQSINPSATTAAFKKVLEMQDNVATLYRAEEQAREGLDSEKYMAYKRARKQQVSEYVKTFSDGNLKQQFVDLVQAMDIDSRTRVDDSYNEYASAAQQLAQVESQISTVDKKWKQFEKAMDMRNAMLDEAVPGHATDKHKRAAVYETTKRKYDLYLRKLKMERDTLIKTTKNQKAKLERSGAVRGIAALSNLSVNEIAEAVAWQQAAAQYLTDPNVSQPIPEELMTYKDKKELQRLRERHDSLWASNPNENTEEIADVNEQRINLIADAMADVDTTAAEEWRDEQMKAHRETVHKLKMQRDDRLRHAAMVQKQEKIQSTRERLELLEKVKGDVMDENTELEMVKLRNKLAKNEAEVRLAKVIDAASDSVATREALTQRVEAVKTTVKQEGSKPLPQVLKERISEARDILEDHLGTLAISPREHEAKTVELKGAIMLYKEMLNNYHREEDTKKAVALKKSKDEKTNILTTAQKRLAFVKEQLQYYKNTPMEQHYLEESYTAEDEVIAAETGLHTLTNPRYTHPVTLAERNQFRDISKYRLQLQQALTQYENEYDAYKMSPDPDSVKDEVMRRKYSAITSFIKKQLNESPGQDSKRTAEDWLQAVLKLDTEKQFYTNSEIQSLQTLANIEPVKKELVELEKVYSATQETAEQEYETLLTVRKTIEELDKQFESGTITPLKFAQDLREQLQRRDELVARVKNTVDGLADIGMRAATYRDTLNHAVKQIMNPAATLSADQGNAELTKFKESFAKEWQPKKDQWERLGAQSYTEAAEKKLIKRAKDRHNVMDTALASIAEGYAAFSVQHAQAEVKQVDSFLDEIEMMKKALSDLGHEMGDAKPVIDMLAEDSTHLAGERIKLNENIITKEQQERDPTVIQTQLRELRLKLDAMDDPMAPSQFQTAEERKAAEREAEKLEYALRVLQQAVHNNDKEVTVESAIKQAQAMQYMADVSAAEADMRDVRTKRAAKFTEDMDKIRQDFTSKLERLRGEQLQESRNLYLLLQQNLPLGSEEKAKAVKDGILLRTEQEKLHTHKRKKLETEYLAARITRTAENIRAKEAEDDSVLRKELTQAHMTVPDQNYIEASIKRGREQKNSRKKTKKHPTTASIITSPEGEDDGRTEAVVVAMTDSQQEFQKYMAAQPLLYTMQSFSDVNNNNNNNNNNNTNDMEGISHAGANYLTGRLAEVTQLAEQTLLQRRIQH